MCYRTGKHTVCMHVRASFSPIILQAAEVKGLTETHKHRVTLPLCVYIYKLIKIQEKQVGKKGPKFTYKN